MDKLINNKLTDKNTVHSYLPVYEILFKDRKDTAENILEIGVFSGGSIDLWYKYFTKAKIYGYDIYLERNMVKENERIKFYQCDAYDTYFAKNHTEKFDIIIDDGPHTLLSMIRFLLYYIPLLTEKGIAIIEDVQSLEWVLIFNTIIEEQYPELKNVYWYVI